MHVLAPSSHAIAIGQPVTIVADARIASADVKLFNFRGRDEHWLAFNKRPKSGGRVIFELTLPMEAVLERQYARFFLRGPEGVTIQELPAEAPIRLNGVPLYWVNGQFFLYNPALFFAPPRIDTIDFQPRGFLHRRVRVLLPRCYDLNEQKRYPVIYFQDGQNIFSPGSAFGSWDADITASRLNRRGELPEVILVAIDNTRERHSEYLPEFARLDGRKGRAGEYLAMLQRELLPLINERYRTIAEPWATGHVGSSLGGLLSYYCAAEFPHVFGAVGAISPSLWVSIRDNLRLADRPAETFARLWVDSGGPGRGDGFERTLRLRDRLMRAGHSYGERFMHLVGPHHGHNEADWARRLPDLLRWMFPPELVLRNKNVS